MAPHASCCSKLGDIEQKNVRYNGQNLLEDIKKDENGNITFKGGLWQLYITENNNGDFCVSNTNAGKVVMFNIEGRIWFRHDGGDVTYNYNYKFSTRKNRCRPCESNYYGRQKKTVFLNILDNSFELDRTYGLSLYSEGRLRS